MRRQHHGHRPHHRQQGPRRPQTARPSRSTDRRGLLHPDQRRRLPQRHHRQEQRLLLDVPPADHQVRGRRDVQLGAQGRRRPLQPAAGPGAFHLPRDQRRQHRRADHSGHPVRPAQRDPIRAATRRKQERLRRRRRRQHGRRQRHRRPRLGTVRYGDPSIGSVRQPVRSNHFRRRTAFLP